MSTMFRQSGMRASIGSLMEGDDEDYDDFQEGIELDVEIQAETDSSEEDQADLFHTAEAEVFGTETIERTSLTLRQIKHALPHWMFVELVSDEKKQEKRTRRRKKNGKQSLSRSIALLPREYQPCFLEWKRERRIAMAQNNIARQKEIEKVMWAAIQSITERVKAPVMTTVPHSPSSPPPPMKRSTSASSFMMVPQQHTSPAPFGSRFGSVQDFKKSNNMHPRRSLSSLSDSSVFADPYDPYYVDFYHQPPPREYDYYVPAGVF